MDSTNIIKNLERENKALWEVAKAAQSECEERDSSYHRPENQDEWSQLEKALVKLSQLKEQAV